MLWGLYIKETATKRHRFEALKISMTLSCWSLHIASRHETCPCSPNTQSGDRKASPPLNNLSVPTLRSRSLVDKVKSTVVSNVKRAKPALKSRVDEFPNSTRIPNLGSYPLTEFGRTG